MKRRLFMNRFCIAVKNAKAIFPQLRIGQIIIDSIEDEQALFYMSDEDLSLAIEKFMKQFEEEK
jgi:hypothetical protein